MKEWLWKVGMSGGGRVFGFALVMALFSDFSLLIPSAIFCETLLAIFVGFFWEGCDAQ